MRANNGGGSGLRYACTDWRPAPRRIPDGHSAFAIGDVHGRADLLAGLHAVIAGRLRRDNHAKRHVVWLGDYIDRGPASRRVLEMVDKGLGLEGVAEHKLAGNHDQYLIEFINFETIDTSFTGNWLDNGGLETWRDFAPGTFNTYIRDPVRAQRVLRDSVGRLTGLLSRLELFVRLGDYVFVHAGIAPGVPLEQQDLADLLLIREPFLSCGDWPHDFAVVHGHTPGPPAVLRHRIGIDSGAFFSDALTAVELCADRLRLHTVLGAGFGKRRNWLWDLKESGYRSPQILEPPT